MRRFCNKCLELINRCFLGLLLLIFAAVLVWDRYHTLPFPNQCTLENVWYVIPAGVLLMLLFWLEKKEKCDVTIQDSPKHLLLRAYEHDSRVQNPIGEADSHGFCIRNWSGTEQLQCDISGRIYYIILEISGIIGGYQLLVSRRANLPSGDFAEVRNAAIFLSEGGSFAGNSYFVRYPNNANLAILLSWLYRLFGNWRSILFLGALLTTASAILVSLTVRNLTKDHKAAVFALISAEVLQGLTWRAFLVYSDNFGMFFVALMLYLVSADLRYRWKVPLLCAAAAFGSFIKVTVAIPMVSLALYAMLREGLTLERTGGAKRLLYGGLCLVLSFLVLLGGQSFLRKSYQLETSGKFYVTDWQYMFMLGQNTEAYGTYNNRDAGELFSQINQEAEESGQDIRYVNERFLSEALGRIRSRGILGNLSFYLGKLDVAYSDGYFNNVQAGLDGELEEPRRDLLFNLLDSSGAYYGVGVVVLQILWDSILLLLLLGAILSRREQGIESSLKLMILAITLYLLIFENRSKYLYMFLPIYITLAGTGLHRSRRFLRNIRKKGS